MNRKHAWVGLLLATLTFLAWFSVKLAIERIYQVDECQNMYMARVLATGQASEFFTNCSLFLLGPLSWIAETAANSAAMFSTARLFLLGIFWVNILLLAGMAGERLISFRGLIALAGAASLVPLWDYGFEIRHDNLILTGVLLIWWMLRTKHIGLLSYALAGAVAVTMLFVAVKTFVYVLPLSFAFLLFPPPAFQKPRWQLSLAWAGGALLAVIVVRICYGTGNSWDRYLAVFRGVTAYSAEHASGGSGRFWPWDTLVRMPRQTPLVVALSAAGCLAVVLDLGRRGKAALTWDGNLPEVLLLLGALAALFANPTPYPYNLVNVVPYAFVLAFRYGAELWEELRKRVRLQPLIAAILLFAHVLPFAIATQRHLNWLNTRQRNLMQLAEAMTDPASDPVFDGIGMVPTRPSIDFRWYLHSLNIQNFLQKGHHLRDLLAKQPAAVLIPSYRTDWLPAEDHDFIRQRYVPLADDFWVLGTVLPSGGGQFAIAHAGRYCVIPVMESSTFTNHGLESLTVSASLRPGETVRGKLDGLPLPAHPVELGVGRHQLVTVPDRGLAVVWLGPHLQKLPQLTPGNHQTLFVNWY